MWKDPIVEETRRLRAQLSASLNHSIDAIYEDMKRRQAQSTEKPVSFPPRKPSEKLTAA